MRLHLLRLKKNKVFMENLRWDVTPEALFKPRFIKDESDKHLMLETQGFIFYVEYLEERASLMVMKTYNLTSKTVGEVQDVPMELLMKSVHAPGVKDMMFMYPVCGELETWLKQELGPSGCTTD